MLALLSFSLKRITHNLDEILVNFSLHDFRRRGQKELVGHSIMCLSVLENVLPPLPQVYNILLGLVFQVHLSVTKHFWILPLSKEETHLVKYSFISFTVTQSQAAKDLRGQREGRWLA